MSATSHRSPQPGTSSNNRVTRSSVHVSSNDQEHPPNFEIQPSTTKKTRCKRGQAEPNNWERKRNALKRMKGEEYRGMKKNRDGNFVQSEVKVPRSIGPACQSSRCEKAKNRFCQSFDEGDREKIFSHFWGKMDWGLRRTYIATLVESMEPKRKTAKTTRRNSTLKYFLKKGDRRFQVCKKMFLATLGLREWQVRD